MEINVIQFLSFIYSKLVSVTVYILEAVRILPKMDVESTVVAEDHEEKMEIQRDIFVFRPFKLTKIHGQVNSSKYPAPRSGHRIVCTESDLYCFGGFNPDFQRVGCALALIHGAARTPLFKELWKFNFYTKKWSLCLDPSSPSSGMPDQLASNSMIVKGSNIIIFGGTGFPFGQSCSNHCHIFNTESLPYMISQLDVDGDLPTPVYGSSIVIHDNSLYTIGGTTGYDYSCDVYRLNLESWKWECVYICKPDIQEDPPGRYRHEIVYDGNRIYVLGGGTSEEVFDLKTIAAFNLTSNKWEYIQTEPDSNCGKNGGYPEPRRCHSCVQYKTENGIEAVIAGGCATNFYFDDIWKLNFKTFQWQLFVSTKLPQLIYFHDAATSGNGCMYIFGGIKIHRRFTRTNDLYKMWVTIPKLSEICWEAICHYNPNLSEYSKINLLKQGIPPSFVKRLPQNK